MSTSVDTTLFQDVADAIGLGNPSIVEKDYYVVQLLQLITQLKLPYHQLVFSGGTSLSKSSVKMFRMSEDVDLKLVPCIEFAALSRNARRQERKLVRENVERLLVDSSMFELSSVPTILDEYRYQSYEIRYPQKYHQAPCLRPYILLELIESEILAEPEDRAVISIYAQALQQDAELEGIACAGILEIQAEKIVSMLRRTASVSRYAERKDDEVLIRHIYDTHHIQKNEVSDTDSLAALVARALQLDIARYGVQHPQLVDSPVAELRYALELLKRESIYQERYDSFIKPLVYSGEPTSWNDAINTFENLVIKVLKKVRQLPL